jgi:hypothetical protein
MLCNFLNEWLETTILFQFVKTASETHHMLKQIFGENASAKTQTNKWFWRFKELTISVENEHVS